MRGAREELEPTPRPPRVALLSACPPLHSRTRAIFTYRRCCSRRRATRTRQSTTPCAFGVRLHWLSMASRRPRVTTAIGRCCSPCGQCVRQCANRRRRQLCTGATRSSTWRGRSPGSGMARVGLVPRRPRVRSVRRASRPQSRRSGERVLPEQQQKKNARHPGKIPAVVVSNSRFAPEAHGAVGPHLGAVGTSRTPRRGKGVSRRRF